MNIDKLINKAGDRINTIEIELFNLKRNIEVLSIELGEVKRKLGNLIKNEKKEL